MTHRYLRAIGLVLGPYLLVSPVAAAQTPWTVTVTPTMNPLPVGTCGAVRLTVLDPQIRDIPRNPSGNLVTIADFDLTVSAPGGNSVVGQYLDRSNWAVCACQDAAVGAEATITATYPGKLLSTRTLVPGIAFQTTQVFSVAPAKSSWNPTGCSAPPATAVIAGAGALATPLQSTTTLTPVTTMTAIGVTAPTATPAPVPPAATIPAPVGNLTGTVATKSSLPGPFNVTVTPKLPASAEVRWESKPGPGSFKVYRWEANQPLKPVPLWVSVSSYQMRADDSRLGPGAEYRYIVVGIYPDGREASAESPTYTTAPMANPAGFTATQVLDGEVRLEWKPVPGAHHYVLFGPGVAAAAANRGSDLTFTVYGVAAGQQSWSIASYYVVGDEQIQTSTAAADFSRVSLNIGPMASPAGNTCLSTGTASVPAPVLYTRAVSPPTMEFSWYAVPGAVGYVVERAKWGTNLWTRVGWTCGGPSPFRSGATLSAATPFSIGGQPLVEFADASGGTTPGQAYDYRMKAISAGGQSAWTVVTGWATPPAGFIPGLSAQVEGNAIRLKFSWVAYGGTNVRVVRMPSAWQVGSSFGYAAALSWADCDSYGFCELYIQGVPPGTHTFTVTAQWGQGLDPRLPFVYHTSTAETNATVLP